MTFIEKIFYNLGFISKERRDEALKQLDELHAKDYEKLNDQYHKLQLLNNDRLATINRLSTMVSNDEFRITELKTAVQQAKDEAAKLQEELDKVKADLDKATAEAEGLRTRIKATSVKTIEEWQEEIETSRQKMESLEQYVEDIEKLKNASEKAIAEALKDNPEFGESNSIYGYGCISICTNVEQNEDGNPECKIAGSITLEPSVTELIDSKKSYQEKMDIILYQLKKSGIYSIIERELIRFGGIKYILARESIGETDALVVKYIIRADYAGHDIEVIV